MIFSFFHSHLSKICHGSYRSYALPPETPWGSLRFQAFTSGVGAMKAISTKNVFHHGGAPLDPKLMAGQSQFGNMMWV